jgi:ATP-dependent RNA helicase RhlB
MKFNELPFAQPVLDGIADAGFTDCTEVQEKILPLSLAGKDVMVQSKTGSGKTAVYLLTFLQQYASAKAAGKNTPKCLIVAPTRELAVQIEEDATKLARHIEGIIIGCFYGGVGYEKQEDILSMGCDLFVCTPGRILDFQHSHKIDFRQFDVFIVDEADRLFDMGFYPDIQKMFSLLRDKKERQTMLFSATLGTQVQNLAWQYMNEAQEITVQPEEITVKEITQELYHVSKDEKFGLFLQVLAKEKPESCLIFTNTKARCIEVAKRLTLNGYPTSYLMGDMPQSKRLSTIDQMKEGKLKFLVATDVAARGLQIDDLSMVVNYDIPEDFESYVHRIGRTARAGKSGKAITFADEEYVYGLEAIENYIKMKIPVIWPEPGDLPVVEDKTKNMRFRQLVSDREYAPSGDDRRRGSRSGGGNGGRGRSRSGAPSRRSPSRSDSSSPRSGNRDRRPRQQGEERRDTYKRPAQGKPRKSYAEMQNLSLEERLKYYKEEYAEESTPAKVAPSPKQVPVKAKTQKPAPAKTEQKKPEKKPGFFARLFGRKK